MKSICKQIGPLRILLAAGAAALFLLGCARSSGPKPLTFTVGGAPHELEFWETLLQEFTAQTDIPVRLDRQPTDTDLRRQGFVFALGAEQPQPDVFLMDVAWIGQFAAADWLHPLPAESLETNRFFSSVLQTADLYKGNLVALPVYVDAGLLYYRRDLLTAHGREHPPETWSELIKLAVDIQQQQRANDPDFYGYVWQGAQYEGLICNFLEVAVSAGGGLQPGAIASEENVRALTTMRDMIHRHGISPPNTYTEMKEEEVRRHFQQGHALFARNWPYAWALHRQPDSPVRDHTGIAPLPAFPGHTPAATLGGWHVGISRFSQRKDEALALVRFILSYEVQRRLAARLGWNPGRSDVYEDPDVLAENPHFHDLREVFERAVARPAVPYYSLMSEALQRHLNAALAGRTDPRPALQAAEREVDRVIQQYGSP